MRILSKCLLVFTFIFLVSIFGPRKIFYYEYGIYYGYDLILEYKLSKAFDKVIETKNFKKIIDLNEFNKKQLIRACIQHPYETQMNFEESIGHKLKKFTETSDLFGYVLWLFYKDGSISRARMNLYPWDISSKDYCTGNNLEISFKERGHSKYRLSEPETINFYFTEDN